MTANSRTCSKNCVKYPIWKSKKRDIQGEENKMKTDEYGRAWIKEKGIDITTRTD